MNERCHDHERYDALMASWFDEDGLSAADREALTAHVAVCASCRESFELASRMESALVSRSSELPSLDGLLPAIEPVSAPSRVWSHPRLVTLFRAVMSPAGIAIILIGWSAMLALRFRAPIASALEASSSQKFTALYRDLSSLLVMVSRGDETTLIAIYAVVTALVLFSTGAITLRYIRHS